MGSTEVKGFIRQMGGFFAAHERAMPWREINQGGSINPYHILVSELMLQQTQVPRVIPKYQQFLARFPSVEDLAEAPLADVLTVWQGLGYNRRAKFLWQAAQMIMEDFEGVMPHSLEELIKLPGVGRNTAGAVMAYAYDTPVIFIETNIRTVFIHHFFAGQTGVPDAKISELVGAGLDAWQQKGGTPRTYYWALMDYGSYLKSTVGNLSRQSKTFVRQTAFKGSKRQVRGAVLRALSEGPHTLAQLIELTGDGRTEVVCQELGAEGLIHYRGATLYLGL